MKRAEKQSRVATAKVDSSGQSGVLVLLGVLFTIIIRQIGAALSVSASVLAATVGGFRLGLLLLIAVSAGTFACVLALPAHSLHDAHQVDPLE